MSLRRRIVTPTRRRFRLLNPALLIFSLLLTALLGQLVSFDQLGVGSQVSAASAKDSFASLVPSNNSQDDSDKNKEGRGKNEWSGWGHDLFNTRTNFAEHKITANNVDELALKWSFVFSGTTSASSQPAVVDDTLYVGGWNGSFYAINAETGKLKWTYDTLSFTGPLAAGQTNAVRDGPTVAEDKVYFADTSGNFYALNIHSGKAVWAKRLDPHPAAKITSSPLVWKNRVYVGISSQEEAYAFNPLYPCCTFRGSMVALDTETGSEVWRYYTVTQPQVTGANVYGTPTYGPSGVAVWSSPAVDPYSGSLFLTTGNNYSGPASPRSDAIIALDLNTGSEKWAKQLTPDDTWNLACNPELLGLPPTAGPNCPKPNIADGDFDFGYSPNIFFTYTNGQLHELVGAGQKSGIFHALDAKTGQVVWQTQLSLGVTTGGIGGIQWGGSWDGDNLYVATHAANPGILFALDPANGHVKWHTPNPADGCTTGGAASYPSSCRLALPAAVTTIPGVVFEGSWDGKMRAYSSDNGAVLWQYDTVQSYTGTNGLTGKGGSINAAGATVANGLLYVNSGYGSLGPGNGIAGNVLLAFDLKRK